MRSEDNPPKAALRTWRASIFRKRLGRVYAADRATAEAVAIEEFHLNDHERKRLLIEESTLAGDEARPSEHQHR